MKWEVHCVLRGFAPIVEANSKEEAEHMVRKQVQAAIAVAKMQALDAAADDLWSIMEMETDVVPCEYDPADDEMGDQDGD